jgi:ABC-type spermidine/putrescine transport system permease subunit II
MFSWNGNNFEYTGFIAKPNEIYSGCIKYINGSYYLYMGYELYIPIQILHLFSFNTPILGVKLSEKSSHLCASLMQKGTRDNTINIVLAESL